MHPQTDSPHIQLAAMSRWYVVSRAIHAVARLGIANHLSDKPTSVLDLAAATNTKPDLLDRVLRLLVSYKIFSYQDGCYALTELSAPLRDDCPYSIRDVLCMADESWWQAFSQLETSLQSGQSSFFEQHQDDFFAHLSKDPERQQNFDKGMAKLSSYDDKAIANAYNFAQFDTIVDMGGGLGGLSQAIHTNAPNTKLILFDTPSVLKQLASATLPAQIHLQMGDFLQQIPRADAYIFKGVLHDFNDEVMTKILSNCCAQMPRKSPLFIAEQVLPDNDLPHPNKTMDIVMMVLLGGRQRTLGQWKHCIEPSGFRFVEDFSTKSNFALMKFCVN